MIYRGVQHLRGEFNSRETDFWAFGINSKIIYMTSASKTARSFSEQYDKYYEPCAEKLVI